MVENIAEMLMGSGQCISVHGPAEIATRGRLKSPPEAGGNRHPGAVDLLGGWGSPLSLTSK